VPDPPLVVRVSGEPAVPPADVRVNGAWAALTKVTVVGDDDRGAKVPSPAFVAVTEQVPLTPAVNVKGADPLTVHPAVPLVAT
jgi:hypothetical protein